MRLRLGSNRRMHREDPTSRHYHDPTIWARHMKGLRPLERGTMGLPFRGCTEAQADPGLCDPGQVTGVHFLVVVSLYLQYSLIAQWYRTPDIPRRMRSH